MASSIDDLARRYGLCRESIYKEARAGRLIVRKLGRRSIILPEDEAAWAQALPRLRLSGAATPAEKEASAKHGDAP